MISRILYTVQTSLGELRRSRDFIDVTLACEDMSINAHKILLSSCSPFFKRLLRAHTNPHPLIFMRGIKSRDLEAIMDFIYLGEANIFQEQFETFWLWQKSWSLRDSVGIQRELLQKMNLSLIPFRESLKKRPREWHMWDNRGEKWKNDDQQHSSHFIDGNSLSDKTSHDNFSWNKRHNWVIDWRPAWGTFFTHNVVTSLGRGVIWRNMLRNISRVSNILARHVRRCSGPLWASEITK